MACRLDLGGTKWVPELEEFWRTTRASHPGRAVGFDLTGVLRDTDLESSLMEK
jgi:hypothetical protein